MFMYICSDRRGGVEKERVQSKNYLVESMFVNHLESLE